MTPIWKLLHLFFSFSFVGTLVVADWNSRAARRTADWSQRALLFGIVQMSSRVAGLGSLLLLGVLGNLQSVKLGLRMADDPWVRWVNGLWLAALLLMLLLTLPSLARLTAAAQAAAGGGSAAGYDEALRRWRLANVALSLLYLALLVLMVFRPLH